MKRRITVCGIMALLIVCVVGCKPKTAEDAGAATENTMKNTGAAVSNVAGKAADATADFASNTSMATTVTPRVKTAILADEALAGPANQIDVDSKDKMVHLKGHVKNNELKKKAGQIAKDTLASMSAPADIKVSNELLTR